MAYTEARKRANEKWNKENYNRFSVAMNKDAYEIAKAIANHEGKSFNRFVVELIEKRIDEYNK